VADELDAAAVELVHQPLLHGEVAVEGLAAQEHAVVARHWDHEEAVAIDARGRQQQDRGERGLQ
jgi:hypothetical protein